MTICTGVGRSGCAQNTELERVKIYTVRHLLLQGSSFFPPSLNLSLLPTFHWEKQANLGKLNRSFRTHFIHRWYPLAVQYKKNTMLIDKHPSICTIVYHCPVLTPYHIVRHRLPINCITFIYKRWQQGISSHNSVTLFPWTIWAYTGIFVPIKCAERKPFSKVFLIWWKANRLYPIL